MAYRDVHGSKTVLERYLNIVDNSNMSKAQKNNIHEFVKLLKIGKLGKEVKERRIANYIQFLLKLHDYFKKDIDKITEKEAEKFYQNLKENKITKKNGMPYSQASKDEFVKALKRYLGWRWDTTSKKYHNSIRWMKENYKKSDKKAITLEQAEKIVKKEKEIRNKTLFIFLFDSGARIEEGLNVTIGDLEAKKDYFKVHLKGQKTQEANRKIAIPLASKYLNKWLKKHPTRKEEDYLFPIQYDNARKIIKQMSKRVLGYELKPHELRHSSATYYIQNGGFGAENIGGFYYRYGWKFGSDEALTYIKTYLYGGEMGQEKVVNQVRADRVEKLEQEVESLKQKLDKLERITKHMDVDKLIKQFDESKQIIEDFKKNNPQQYQQFLNKNQ